MTAVPPPVPPEIVERAAEALEDAAMRYLGRDLGTIFRDDIAAEAIAAVYGDIVEAARRDALTEAIDVVEETLTYGARHHAVNALIDLLTATAPPRAPTASVSGQGAVPRTPGTPGAQIAAEGREATT